MKNQTTIFETIEPHAQPVVVADLLAEIEGLIAKHVVLKAEAAAALAVWVLHTYVFELRDTVAYVVIESPEKRCGKTTLLSVLAAMAHRPLIASNLTTGALFHAIDICHPTLFIDEADTFLAGNGAMRGIINSGNTWRTAFVLRQARARRNRNPDRASNSPENINSAFIRYSCWCPKVIAMIGETPDTIADRSIVVPMTRKFTSQPCAPLAELKTDEIKAKCARFAQDAGPTIANAEKICGEGLNDRAADTFDPLYVIARLTGEAWEQKLHAAAMALSSTTPEHSSRTELLKDILAIFLLTRREKMFSRELTALLRDNERVKTLSVDLSSLDEFRIAKLLRPYGIKPKDIRIGARVGKGYLQEEIFEVFKRYIPKAQIDKWFDELENQSRLYREADAETKRNAGLGFEEISQMVAQAGVPKAPAIANAE